MKSSDIDANESNMFDSRMFESNTIESKASEMHGFEIAIIGMAGQFPGADDVDQFWQNIAAGVESVRPLTDAELDAAGVSMAARSQADFIRNASVLARPEDFDAEFFGYSPREAQAIDPQQRRFLETSWLALENAGYTAEKFSGTIGVFASSSGSSYLLHHLFNQPTPAQNFLSDMLLFGNNTDLLATRVSYKLNLTGPSFTLGSACSSSMVALHYACQSLLAGECDIALGGGVHIGFPSHSGYHYEGSGILSHDGHCRTFDARASGTIGGDGVGVVVLKRLQDALDSGDHLYAIIKGSAVNNDGAEKIGFTAPSVTGQTAVLRRALFAAGVGAESISYIEAHGTATHLGDPMEMKALRDVYDQVGVYDQVNDKPASLTEKALAEKTVTKQKDCAVASVKANLGHVDSAAGVTGVMKVAQMLTHRYLPPAINFSRLNPEIDLTGSRLYIPATGKPWQNQDVLRAGVSAFGIGGTNAHMILQQAPAIPPSGFAYPQQLLCFSAKSPAALQASLRKFRQWLEKYPQLPLADIAYTLHVGRHEMDYRYSLVCHDHASAMAALDSYLLQEKQPAQAKQPDQSKQRNTARALSSPAALSVVFMFSGQGAQYPGMMQGYYEQEPQFKAVVDECAEILLPLLGRDIRPLIFETLSHDKTGHDRAAALYRTRYTQPALFVVEYALSRLLLAWGIRPTACIGHSIGEYVAACLAGVFTLADALKIVVRRAELMDQMPAGKMLAVGLDAETLQGYLPEQSDMENDIKNDIKNQSAANAGFRKKVTLAAYNAPELCVVSGEATAISALETRLAQDSIETRMLHTSHAFHSAMMEGCLEPFRQFLANIELSPPKLPFISGVTGNWISDEQATSADYWVRQLREPVAFSQGIACLLAQSQKAPVLLEVGPGSALSGLASVQITGVPAAQRVFSSTRNLKQNMPDRQYLLGIIGQLWQQGVGIDWEAVYQHQKRHRLPLPGYVFQHQRYSLNMLTDDRLTAGQLTGAVPHRPDSGQPKNQRLPLEQWSHHIRWKQMNVLSQDNIRRDGQVFLIFMDHSGIGKRLTVELTRLGGEVWQVTPGKYFRHNTSARQVTMNPQHSEDYQTLAQLLKQQNVQVNNIIYACPVTRSASRTLDTAFTHYESLLHIARTFVGNLKINILSNRLHAITEYDRNDPAKALLIGPCRVIPKEFSQVQCKSIDIALPATRWSLPLLNAAPSNTLIAAVLAEILDETEATGSAETGNEKTDSAETESIVAIRGRHRYVPLFETARLPVTSSPLLNSSFRQGGHYLITGGFGGIGATVATYLAQHYQPYLIFIGRSELPAENQWSDWLETHDADNKRSRHIRLLRQLQQMGAVVSVISADLADEVKIGQALTERVRQHGQIHGIFHCAGVADGGLIQNRRFEDSLQIFRAKVLGTQVLDNWFKRRPLDFFVLCSSLASSIGPVGQVAYCAANAFEEAYALSHDQLSHGQLSRDQQNHQPHSGRKNPTRYLAIGWDAWREVGMAVDSLRHWYQDDAGQGNGGEDSSIGHGIRPEEGCRLLELLLAHGDPVYAISTRGLPLPDADQATDETAEPRDSAVSEQSSTEQPLYPRPLLRTDFQPPRNPTEEIIADIWQEKMGIGPLGVFDDFFELNGHSLMAVQIIAKIKQRLQVAFPVGFIYEHSTIEQLAGQVNLRSQQAEKRSLEKRSLEKPAEGSR
ncbi:MAG: acyltransferase domain-containing protein [Enterobacteriaceae bacterium]|jgi:acyl transferase domain-containing protein/acyl carrier protein|nr:acyltransferase domain-containing protein [Enterobacteriaceae bacterium]